jgi:formate hydrogenlyase subunit 6/NADH:ubiquinone oxidoreductase subunit I
MSLKFGAMLSLVLDSLLKKPITILYPNDKKTGSVEKLRGNLKYYSERCIGCKMCVKDCPTKAIEIVKVGEKQFEAQIDLAKCIYCAQCVDSCPVKPKALESTNEFELASLSRDGLRTTRPFTGTIIPIGTKPTPTPNAKPENPVNPETKPA